MKLPDRLLIWAALALLPMAFPAVAALDTVETASADLPRLYQLDGVVEAVNQGTVSAQTSGRVLAVNVDVDDVVNKDDVIVSLEDSQQQAARRQADANLAAAAAKRRDAEREYRRIKGVFEREAVSKADMDRISAMLEQAQAAEKAAQAALHQAEQELAYTIVRAPYNGVVTGRLVEVGETAQPGQGLMSGFSLDSLRVSVDVPQSLVDSIRRQREARVRLNGKWITAQDVTVFPIADPASNTFEVRVRLPDGIAGVFPGMYVKVGFVSGSQRQLVIPLSAVVVRSELIGVYVVNDSGKVFFRHIRLGSPAGPEHVVILSGLRSGEQIAADPVAAGILLKSQRNVQVDDE
jgi:RND family efflux transporter MFP subunit